MTLRHMNRKIENWDLWEYTLTHVSNNNANISNNYRNSIANDKPAYKRVKHTCLTEDEKPDEEN